MVQAFSLVSTNISKSNLKNHIVREFKQACEKKKNLTTWLAAMWNCACYSHVILIHKEANK